MITQQHFRLGKVGKETQQVVKDQTRMDVLWKPDKEEFQE